MNDHDPLLRADKEGRNMYQVTIMCDDLVDSIKVWEVVHTQLRIMDGISRQPRGGIDEPTMSKFRLTGKVTLDVTNNVLRNLSEEQLWIYYKPIQEKEVEND